jgi:5-hydroxyisourate hydrolase
MIGISTHVLDTARGEPASGILVVLKRGALERRVWDSVGSGITDAAGRIASVLDPSETLQEGAYQLTFHVSDYFGGREHFYPEISVQFLVHDASTHYHVPLLLSPYGYSTYRGS